MAMDLPPELAGLMGGSGGAPMGGGGDPMMGGAPAQGEPAAGGEDTVTILTRMIEDAKSYIEAEQDEEDKLTMTKVLTTLQQYLADEQKEMDDMLGGKVSPRLMRRAIGGGPA